MQGGISMRRWKNYRNKVLSMAVSVSLAVTGLPCHLSGMSQGGVKTALAADTDSDAGDSYGEPEVIRFVDNGSSKNGLLNTKAVDASGKTVDFAKMTGTENALGDGTILSILEKEEKNSGNIDIGEEEDSALTNRTVKRLSAQRSLKGASAATYTSPYITPVRNQGTWGVCWSFAATAAIEANILKNASVYTTDSYTKSNLDLSERHMAWFSHNTFATSTSDLSYGDGDKKNTPAKAYVGGNAVQVAAYLARSSGVAPEAEAVYDTSGAMKGVAETNRYSSVAQMTDWLDLGDYKKDSNSIQTAITTIKKAVEDYGAVQASYYSGSNYLKGTKGTSYYSTQTYTNHAVCIVGWDDTYSASNFKINPGADGAWLVKNSWGDSWGDSGYFWMSYYEKSLSGLVAFKMEDVAKTGRTYCYTGGGRGATCSTGSTSISAANVYRCQENEALNAVGVYTTANNMKVKIEVYRKESAMSSPVDGTLVAQHTVDDAGVAGFHKLNFASELPMLQGQYYSIVVTVSTIDGNPAYMAMESMSGTKSLTGQTYYKLSGGWIDSNSASMNKKNGDWKNACIYAYTSDKDNLDLFDQLSVLISTAKAMDKTTVTAIAGADTWTKMSQEIARAEKILAIKQAAPMKREIREMQRVMSFCCSKNLYSDSGYTTGAGAGGVQIYLNGGSVKTNGVTTNYKTKTVFTQMERVQSWKWLNKSKGYTVKGYYGKYVAAVTTTLSKPELNTNGTLKTTDSAAASIAGVKMSGSKLTITPKQEGDVYVWVLYYPTSVIDQENILAQQTDFAVTKVHVGTAPAAVRLYDNESDNPLDNATVYSSAIVPAGFYTDFYVKGTVGSVANATMRVIDDSDIGYRVTVPAKYAPYITVNQIDLKHFRVSVADNILTLAKSGKNVTVPLSVSCDHNTKKAVFKVLASNSVKKTTVEAADTNTRTETDSNGIFTVKMDASTIAAQTALVKETTELYDSSLAGTDGTKIVRLPGYDEFERSSAAGVKVLCPLSKHQNKVSMAVVKGQPGVYKITAAKGVQPGTEVYFMIYHNLYKMDAGTGFQLVKVVVGNANHNTSMSLVKSDAGSAVFTPGKTQNSLKLESAVQAAQTCTLTETVTLADSSQAGTDESLIYPLPSVDGFEIISGNQAKVTGPLSAAQKKVTMKAISGTAGYKVTAAKGTPEGTEAHFLLYHNTGCYSVISVAVGTPNKVQQISLSCFDGSLATSADSAGDKIVTITLSSAKTAKQTANLQECVVLENPSTAKTDATLTYRLRDQKAFKVALNQSTVSVIGVPTTSQKKVSLVVTDKAALTYRVTAAKGTPDGTVAYFMIYHNYVGAKSGKGYQLVKVTVG